MIMNDFAIFILTHGRPNNVITFDTLKKCGYTGKLYLIIDNEDNRADEYYENFGRDNVIMFDKQKYAEQCDACNNFGLRSVILMARNACFDIARKIGVTYFMELDDDYTSFKYTTDNYYSYDKGKMIKDINLILFYYLEFYKSINCLSLAFAQDGDFIGGERSSVFTKKLSRKCMNSFICSTERQFAFIGAMNDDVNTYTTLGSRGKLFFTTMNVRLHQKETQQQGGGITDVYKKYGTYCKSFTTVINMPSSVVVGTLNTSNKRLHHKINWKNTVPVIINEQYKKI